MTCLGIEVFGAEVFGRSEEEGATGYKKEMELLELEYDARVQEIEEEIEEIGDTAIQQMKASEKVIVYLCQKIWDLWLTTHVGT